MTQPRNALIVGAAVGIGRRIALALAEQHWRVAVCYHANHLQAALLVRDLMLTWRREAQPLECDFTDDREVTRMLRYLDARWKSLDALVWAPAPGDVPPGVAPDDDPLLGLARAVAPGMKARGFGRILVADLGVSLLTAGRLATELSGDGVTVNAVTPRGSVPARVGSLRPIPFGYFESVVDGADAARFFVSDAAAGLTGTHLQVEQDWRDLE